MTPADVCTGDDSTVVVDGIVVVTFGVVEPTVVIVDALVVA